MKKILITSTDSMMIQFLVPHVQNLINNGYQVDIACSIVKNRMEEIKTALPQCRNIYTVKLSRSPLKLSNFNGLKQLKKIIAKGDYDLVWTNEPVMGVMTRLAAKKARKKGTKVLYMAHGFHFFKGAPKKNWLLYYPIEKFMTRYTDVLLTINEMDFALAKAKFKRVKHIDKIHGTGINFSRLDIPKERDCIRNELGINDDDFVLISVGELNGNKNQKVILKAIHYLQSEKIRYFLAGVGKEEKNLQKLVKKYHLEKQVAFLGYVRNIGEYLKASDVLAFPSYREGLGLAGLEAMYMGLPILTSDRHGINDYSINEVTGFKYNPDDACGFAAGIKRLQEDEALINKISTYNKKEAELYGLANILNTMLGIIHETVNE